MKNNSTVKYLGTAMAVGGTMMIGASFLAKEPSLKKKIKKTAGKAIDAMDTMLNSVQNMMK